DFVDSEKVDFEIRRHRFDGAYPVVCTWRDALFLTRYQRDSSLADPLTYLVVNFPREQSQGQTQHSSIELEHAFDAVMRLASVGRTQERYDFRRYWGRARTRTWLI